MNHIVGMTLLSIFIGRLQCITDAVVTSLAKVLNHSCMYIR